MVNVEITDFGDLISFKTSGVSSFSLKINEDEVTFNGTKDGNSWVMMCSGAPFALTTYNDEFDEIKYPVSYKDYWERFPGCETSLDYYLEYLEKVYNHLNTKKREKR